MSLHRHGENEVFIGVFSKWSRTFIEFREFKESEKSLRHELHSVQGSALLHVSLWDSGIISVSYTGGPGFQSNLPFDFYIFLSLNSANSVKTLRENSNELLVSFIANGAN